MDSGPAYWKRRHNRRTFLGGAVGAGLGVASLALTGCGDDDSEDVSPTPETTAPAASAPAVVRPTAGGTLRVLVARVGGVLDIHRTTSPVERDIWHHAGNFLVRFNVDTGLPEADLAASLPQIPGDGTELIFKLNPAATFQQRAPANGRLVTAEDVKLTFDRIAAPETKSPRGGNYSNVESITVLDPQTLRFKLKTPQPDLVNYMCDQYEIVIPRELAARGPEAIQKVEDVVGSGPYELTRYESGQQVTLRRRADGYWKKDTAWLDAIEYIQQADPQTRLQSLLAKQAEAASELPVDQVKTIEKDPAFVAKGAPYPTRELLLIHHQKPPFDNPLVRQALWRALDRRAIYDRVFGGGGRAGGPFTPAAVNWALPDTELQTLPGFGPRPQELAEAKKLLSAAGLPGGFEDTVLTARAFLADVVNEVVVANLAEVGVRLQTEAVPDLATLVARQAAGTFTLATTLLLSGPFPDAQLLTYHHSTRGARNYGKYNNPAMDAKLERQSQMLDTQARRALVNEIQRDLIREPGPGWIGSRMVFDVFSSRVQGTVRPPFPAAYQIAERYWLR